MTCVELKHTHLKQRGHTQRHVGRGDRRGVGRGPGFRHKGRCRARGARGGELLHRAWPWATAPFRRAAFYFIGDNPYEMFVIRRRAKWLCGPMARRRPEGDGPGHPAYDANAAFEGYA